MFLALIKMPKVPGEVMAILAFLALLILLRILRRLLNGKKNGRASTIQLPSFVEQYNLIGYVYFPDLGKWGAVYSCQLHSGLQVIRVFDRDGNRIVAETTGLQIQQGKPEGFPEDVWRR